MQRLHVSSLQTHANNLRVYAGAHYASQADNSHDVQKALVSRVIIHPRYDTRTHRYDFMILKLDRDIWESGTVKYVRLPTTDAFPDAYTECFIVGWGMVNKYSRTSDVLMKGTATATSYSNEVRVLSDILHSFAKHVLCDAHHFVLFAQHVLFLIFSGTPRQTFRQLKV